MSQHCRQPTGSCECRVAWPLSSDLVSIKEPHKASGDTLLLQYSVGGIAGGQG
jgi:hypothetical protein